MWVIYHGLYGFWSWYNSCFRVYFISFETFLDFFTTLGTFWSNLKILERFELEEKWCWKDQVEPICVQWCRSTLSLVTVDTHLYKLNWCVFNEVSRNCSLEHKFSVFTKEAHTCFRYILYLLKPLFRLCLTSVMERKSQLLHRTIETPVLFWLCNLFTLIMSSFTMSGTPHVIFRVF